VSSALRVCATGLWTGFFPIAPGTAGSLLAVALVPWLPLAPLGMGALLLLGAAFLVGIPASARAEKEFGEDGGPIVVDEVVGQWIALAGLAPSPIALVAGFVLFRLFDILKPFPARSLERVGGGLGVMLDDVVAGLYAAVALRLVLRAVPLAG
jgi:phosphatidylglycerophosphatase A